MLGVTIVGLFLTPVFYVTLRRLVPYRPPADTETPVLTPGE